MFSAFQTFGRLGAGARAVAAAWTPAALWPTGTEAGMWIDPSNLASQWQDYTGTTPVATPGSVADSANPVGLALDIRAGAPDTLGPELVVNGTFDTGIADWTADFLTPTLSWDSVNHRIAVTGNTYCTATTPFSVTAGKTYLLSATLAGTDPAIWFGTNGTTTVGAMLLSSGQSVYTAQSSGTLYAVIQGRGANGSTAYFDNISVKEIPGNHLLQATSTARPLLSAYDGQTLGPGDTYPSTGFPIYQKYDGTDDGMATASFAAGTLSNAMDCLIAVRRDAATKGVLFSMSYGSAAYCGHYEAGSSAVGRDAVGTPTVWVDGTQLAGGTSVTASTLDTALTVGNWHIVEFQGLDLGAFTAFQFGNWFSGFQFNGAQGGILLFPSSTSAADRDAARTWLGAKVGLTL